MCSLRNLAEVEFLVCCSNHVDHLSLISSPSCNHCLVGFSLQTLLNVVTESCEVTNGQFIFLVVLSHSRKNLAGDCLGAFAGNQESVSKSLLPSC